MIAEQTSFWSKPTQINLIGTNLLIGDFVKYGKVFKLPTLRTYYLISDCLYYSDQQQNLNRINFKGMASLITVGVSFKQNNTIQLINRNFQLQISTMNQAQFQIWKAALEKICILSDFNDQFKIESLIGQGSFASVHLVKSLKDNKLYALKMIRKIHHVHEIQSLRKLHNCPGVMQLYQVFHENKTLMLVTEYLNGGELIQKNPRVVNLTQLQKIMQSLLVTLREMHALSLIHRDIKPSNILFNSKQQPVLIDFGLSVPMESKKCSQKCGTPGYIAPEVLVKRTYNEKCDVFSLGVTFFILVYGYHPFRDDDMEVTLKNNQYSHIEFPYLENIPYSLVDLLQQMLKKQPRERVSAEMALMHPFFEEEFDRNIQVIFPSVILNKMQKKKLSSYNIIRDFYHRNNGKQIKNHSGKNSALLQQELNQFNQSDNDNNQSVKYVMYQKLQSDSASPMLTKNEQDQQIHTSRIYQSQSTNQQQISQMAELKFSKKFTTVVQENLYSENSQILDTQIDERKLQQLEFKISQFSFQKYKS